MSTKQHDRSSTDADTLDDATAMLAAAEADPSVSKRLGKPYLKTMAGHLAHAQALQADAPGAHHEVVAGGSRVHLLAEQLLHVLRDVRDALKIADEPMELQQEFGLGAYWSAQMPTALAAAGHGMIASLKKHKGLADAAGIDKQHQHDLAELSTAIDEAHQHHRAASSDQKHQTAARLHAFAALRADAHHVRLVARLIHRGDADALARFESPVARHAVVHRAKVAPVGKPAG